MSVHVAGRQVDVASPGVLWAVRPRSPRRRARSSSGSPSCSVLCMIGAVGALLSLPPGWEVLGTTPTFEWGILITAYVFFAVTTSGLCLASSLGTVFNIPLFLPLEKRHAILAVLCLCTAFGIIALDLHYPVRLVFGAVLSPSPFSPMWWMGVFYGVYLVFLFTEVWSMFTNRWAIHRVACTLSTITAVFAPLTLGAVFGVLAVARLLARGLHAAADDRRRLPVGRVAARDRLLLRHPVPAHGLGAGGAPGDPGAAAPAHDRPHRDDPVPPRSRSSSGCTAACPASPMRRRALLVGPLAFQFWIFRVGTRAGHPADAAGHAAGRARPPAAPRPRRSPSAACSSTGCCS